jgi:hypothetical protein
MFTHPFKRPHGIAAIWLLLAGGCVNLTPPWENVKDAVSQTGGTLIGGTTGPIHNSTGGALGTDGFPAGGANGDDAPGTGGVGGGAQLDGGSIVGSGGTGGTPDVGGALDTSGLVGSGGVVASGGTVGTGGGASKGGNAPGGAGGATATGGSSAPPDAQAPVDQAQKNDKPSGPEVVPQTDAGVDAPQMPDAPPGPDLPTDPAVVVPTVGLVAYYPCEQATGTGATLPDLSLKGNDAVLTGPTGFATGQVGNALVLTATNGVDGGASGGYASLPPGIVAGATEMTVSAWFKINSTITYDNFQRVFDFGTSTATSSMYFTPRNASGLPQFTIRFRPEAGTEIKQDLISTNSATTEKVWHHVAVVLDAAGGHLYLDGVSVESSAARTAMTMKPADLGAMPNNWIGRSEFANDPYFDGMIDEFRVYTRALVPAEIAILFAAR